MNSRLLNELASIDVNNVYIYVADAVRYDFAPNSVMEVGATLKTVAASTISPTSFASLITGVHPPKHGVFNFSNVVPDQVFTIFDEESYETRFVNNIQFEGNVDPIFSALDVPANSLDDPFSDLSDPFMIMERGQGGHTPYGSFEGTTREYFESRGADVDLIKREYRDGIKSDASTFVSRLDRLNDLGLLEDTLVIYTSDHGELLGEGGFIGHNAPTRPELVYVPTVFIHPRISNDRRTSTLFRHVDVLPTVFDAVGLNITDSHDLDGISLLTDGAKPKGVSFYHFEPELSTLPNISKAVYEGVWDLNGGHVFARTPKYERMMVLLGHLLFGATRTYIRRNLYDGLKSYYRDHQEFLDPGFNQEEAEKLLSEIRTTGRESGSRTELTQEAKDHLRDLGYR